MAIKWRPDDVPHEGDPRLSRTEFSSLPEDLRGRLDHLVEINAIRGHDSEILVVPTAGAIGVRIVERD